MYIHAWREDGGTEADYPVVCTQDIEHLVHPGHGQQGQLQGTEHTIIYQWRIQGLKAKIVGKTAKKSFMCVRVYTGTSHLIRKVTPVKFFWIKSKRVLNRAARLTHES